MASRREYLTQTELAEYADITITDETEADDQITQAEEIIDAYVGHQDRFYKLVAFGVLTSVNSTTVADTSGDTPLNVDDDYYKGCEIEIVGGTGIGSREIISASSKSAMSVTVRAAFATAPVAGSAYKIYQLGKFPRVKDTWHNSDTSTPKYYKSIPEAVKRATAAQVEYMIQMGDNFFSSERSNMKSEMISEYSYTVADAGKLSRLIAPKARALLRGITNRTGRLER